MYRQNSIVSDLECLPIPLGTRAYIGQRARNNYYDFVMEKYRESKLSQAMLARRTGKHPAQINRMLANPSNWTIETVAILLAAICAEELIPSSTPFAGRARRNSNQATALQPKEENPNRASGAAVQVIQFEKQAA